MEVSKRKARLVALASLLAIRRPMPPNPKGETDFAPDCVRKTRKW